MANRLSPRGVTRLCISMPAELADEIDALVRDIRDEGRMINGRSAFITHAVKEWLLLRKRQLARDAGRHGVEHTPADILRRVPSRRMPA